MRLGACMLLAVSSFVSRAAADESLADLEQQAFTQAVARVAPSLVRLQSVGGAETVGDVLVGDGATTGIVVDPDGYRIEAVYAK